MGKNERLLIVVTVAFNKTTHEEPAENHTFRNKFTKYLHNVSTEQKVPKRDNRVRT